MRTVNFRDDDELPKTVEGVVEEGDHRGHALGFPTANISLDAECVLPKDGIYAGQVVRDNGATYVAAISLGARPTYYRDGGARILEAHLLDFEGGLYGERLRVILELSIRSQVAFDSNEELTAQIRADVAAVRQYASRLAPRGDSARAKTSDDL